MSEVLRTDIINYFAERYGYKTYLEIGVNIAADNFDKIIVPQKTGVDPAVCVEYQMSSDDFFEQNKSEFDLIFIDGDHRAVQVYKDVINSLKVLSKGGTILLHDCNPEQELYQASGAQSPTMPWTGDGWKSFVRLRVELRDYKMFVVNTNFGVGVIRKTEHPQELLKIEEPLTYSNLEKNRKKWLNLIEVDELEKTLSNE